MPAPTNTEEIRRLCEAVARIEEQIKHLQQQLTRYERQLDKFADQLNDVDRRLVVVEAQATENKKVTEERRHRQWGLIVAVVASVLTLIANIILVLVKK